MFNNILGATRGFWTVGALTGTGLGLICLGRVSYYTVLDVTEAVKDLLGYRDIYYFSKGSYIECGKWMIATFAASAICTKLAYVSTRLPKNFTTQTVLDSLRITDWTEYFPAVVSK